MSIPAAVQVRVPATTANLGPGFDCLGAALTLYNQFQFTALTAEPQAPPSLVVEVEGLEAERVQGDRQNLAYQAFCTYFEKIQQPLPSLHLKISLGIPLARGLGSSATAIVGGLVGANALAGSPLTIPQLLDLAITLEGHPDNVAPALLGGCQLAAHDEATQTWTLCPLQWSDTIVPIVAIPAFELSTAAARAVLPQQCSYPDAIFNMAHVGLLIKGLETGRGEWIHVALQDRLHQPYRATLIPGMAEVQAAAMDAGALGVVISGAGPTLLAFGLSSSAPAIAHRMQTAWQQQGIQAQVLPLSLDWAGTTLQPLTA